VAFVARPAEAQNQGSAPAGFELTRSVQQSLARIQELWLQWVGASIRDDRPHADESLRGLIGTVREVGFHYLPDLALGAAAQARQSALAGEFERARRQLEAAEALDPERPETAFAAAAVARAESDWSGALLSTARGFWLTRSVEASRFAGASFVLWVGYVLLLVAALFIVLLAFGHAPDAVQALREKFEPPLSTPMSAILLALALVAPALLPSGIFWLFLVWSVLLWAFASRSERIVLAIGWLVAASVPLVAARIQRDVTLEQSPPLRAMESFEQHRLHGGIFPDLQVLRSALPTHPAVLELIADVHRTLGQWELARATYRRVLIDEEGNIPVLLNLGAYHFRKGDYAFANAYFTRATQAGTPSAAAWFNLSVGYSAAYLFDESRNALSQARSIDSAAVDAWISTENPDRVLTFNGSLARRAELRSALVVAWGDPQAARHSDRTDLLRAGATALGAPLAAWAVAGWLGRSKRRSPIALHLGPPVLDRWLRALLPALPASERGAGFWAWGNLLLLSVLVLLPQAFDLTGDLPLPGWPGPAVLGAVAALGAALYLGLRVRTSLARERE
jgi:tetratricopeptide (TPR) repeat protein